MKLPETGFFHTCMINTCTQSIMVLALVLFISPQEFHKDLSWVPCFLLHIWMIYMLQHKIFVATFYADDANLLSPMCSFSSSNSLNAKNLTEVTNSINDVLSHVHESILINKLSVNVSKTNFMIFHHQQRRIDTLIPDLNLDSEPIEHVSEYNFLCLTLDEHLSCKPHVPKVANKTSRTLGILRRLKNIIPISVLRTLYNTIILPKFHYCILSWGFRMGRLKLLHKRAVRVMSGSRYNAHTDPLFKKLHLVKLSDLFTLNVYKMYYKLRHVSLPTNVANMFKDFSRIHEHETRQALNLDELMSIPLMEITVSDISSQESLTKPVSP